MQQKYENTCKQHDWHFASVKLINFIFKYEHTVIVTKLGKAK